MSDQNTAVDHELAIAGLALAVPGLIQTCIHFVRGVRGIVTQAQNLQTAPEDIQELLLRVEVASARIDSSLLVLKEVAAGMEFSLQSLLCRLLSRLQLIMSRVQDRINQPANTPGAASIANRGRLVQSWSKPGIEDGVDQLNRWQMDFDGLVSSLAMSGRLVPSANGPGGTNRISQVVQRTQALRDAFLGTLSTSSYQTLHSQLPDKAKELRIPYTTVYLPGLPDRGNFRVVTERRKVDSLTPSDAVPRLAQMLHTVDPDMMGLLRCIAYHDNRLSYEIPAGFSYEPRSLREALIKTGGRPRHSLDQRLGLLTRLASALHFVHVAGNVHKQVRSDNVLIFQDQSQAGNKKDHALRHCFLVGFDLARGTGTASEQTGPDEFHKNIYLPEGRQGTQVHPAKFSQWDDVFSYGVVALEICLWTPFVTHVNDDPSKPLALSPILKGRTPGGIIEKYCSAAMNEIPPILGQTVATMIYDCLTCLKPTSESPLKQKLRSHVDRAGSGAEYVLQQLMTLSL
ncbi:hypothetical protein PRZ48_015008 [Zasmidium cellare]|uniref:Protein kinase domain-containing protein n=1 Tax=Zasmidium cellare TaxID=395010 RepID=A0ABR0DXW7_ZASCE|nr:hypothetical protein PRZ48_015008 [Zasmidium cellare]